MTRLLCVLALLTGPVATTACIGFDGACAGCSDLLDNCYCYEGWTAEECAVNDDEEVNGASWTHYPAQSCDEAGYVATN